MSKDKTTPATVILDLKALGTDFSAEDVAKSANRAVLPVESCYVELFGFELGEADPARFTTSLSYKVRVITGINKDGALAYGAEFMFNNPYGNLTQFNSAAKPELKEGEKLEDVRKVAGEKATAQNSRALGELVRNSTDGKATIGETTAEMQTLLNELFIKGQLPIGIYNPSTNLPSYASSYTVKATKEVKQSVQQDRADISWGGTTRASAIAAMKKGALVPPDVRQFVKNKAQANTGRKTDTHGGGDNPGGLGQDPANDE